MNGLARRLEAAGFGVEDLAPLDGGHSGLTFSVRLVAPSGARTEAVVKAAPEGRPAVGRHDVLRQARLFGALAAAPGVAVPRPLHVDADPPPFFAMERLSGEALEPILTPADQHPPPDVVRARALASARMLAALHAVDAAAVAPEPVVTVADELDRWSRTMAAVDPALVPGAAELEEALRAAVPADARPGVVHGDYRLGNLLCAGPTVSGVIDWEIWCLADPRLDLGWYLVHCDPAEYPGIGVPSPGMPMAAELRAEYEAASGAPVGDWPWFDAYGRFKLAAIMAHNLKRHREGRHVDPFQERLPPTIAHQIQRGLAVL